MLYFKIIEKLDANFSSRYLQYSSATGNTAYIFHRWISDLLYHGGRLIRIRPENNAFAYRCFAPGVISIETHRGVGVRACGRECLVHHDFKKRN